MTTITSLAMPDRAVTEMLESFTMPDRAVTEMLELMASPGWGAAWVTGDARLAHKAEGAHSDTTEGAIVTLHPWLAAAIVSYLLLRLVELAARDEAADWLVDKTILLASLAISLYVLLSRIGPSDR